MALHAVSGDFERMVQGKVPANWYELILNDHLFYIFTLRLPHLLSVN